MLNVRIFSKISKKILPISLPTHSTQILYLTIYNFTIRSMLVYKGEKINIAPLILQVDKFKG